MKTIPIMDEMTADFLLMYCEGRSALWRMFFGWRRTTIFPTYCVYYFRGIPNDIMKTADKLAHRYGAGGEIVGE